MCEKQLVTDKSVYQTTIDDGWNLNMLHRLPQCRFCSTTMISMTTILTLAVKPLRLYLNKENIVFKDGIGVQGLRSKLYGNHYSNYHCNHGNHHGIVSRD